MKMETRIFEKGTPQEVRHLLFICESEEESKKVDWALGDRPIPFAIEGEVTLADGYGEHYIRLVRKKEEKSQTTYGQLFPGS